MVRSASLPRHEVNTDSKKANNSKAPGEEANPFKKLVYIYVGTSKFNEDKEFYAEKLGAKLLWEFKEFGARVAGFDLCGLPYLLIADHVKAPSKRLIYEVEDINAASDWLKARGWKSDGQSFEIPDGPCMNFKDESGNEYAILQMTRPHILEKEFRKGG